MKLGIVKSFEGKDNRLKTLGTTDMLSLVLLFFSHV